MASVDEVESLSEDLALFLSTGELSDVTFLVEGEELLAHRNLLAFRSEYFRALLFGGLAESKQAKIELDVKFKPFKLILQYIYTGRVELEQLEVEDFIDLLGLVHEYKMEKLLSAMVDILKDEVSLETCYWIVNNAVKYELEELLESCRIFWKSNGTMVMQHPSFKRLTEAALKLFMESNFDVAEIDIFMAAKSWCAQFPKIDPKSILANVKYSRISIQDLVQKVKPTGLVDAEVLWHAIEGKFDHPQCILYEDHKCREISFTRDNENDNICFDTKCIICCIEFHHPFPVIYPIAISSDDVNWTNITDDIAERTQTRMHFKKAISARYICFQYEYNFSIRGLAVWK